MTQDPIRDPNQDSNQDSNHDQVRDPSSGPDAAAGTTPPADPVFAAPTPAGVLPVDGLGDLRLPGPGDGDPSPDVARQAPIPAGGRAGAARTRRVAGRAALAVVALAVVGGAVAAGVTTARERATTPVPAAVAQARDVNAVQLVLGSCLRDVPPGDVGRVTVVPCTDEHVAQVVGRTDSATGAVWPGHDALVRKASADCGPGLLGAAGREAEGLSFVVLVPSEDGWAAGDRTGLCLAVSGSPGSDDLLV
ncbi:septum formation family protein [Isoptericola sp. NPDC019693]|uniref:septum formation family protein n=1 Tax=Isoptericola sp. NPDC019693 TaxID=3364009 RepID=UPI00378FE49E